MRRRKKLTRLANYEWDPVGLHGFAKAIDGWPPLTRPRRDFRFLGILPRRTDYDSCSGVVV